ncbi:MAG TPA: class I SAM-dependent methyltransferase [Candidatus Saccharimonadales bacterium]|nr:class I SAM-dependent methyltransferase [Candidatus Saccharimonadales bacterium]
MRQNDNKLTLDTYQNNLQAYIDHTPEQINPAEGEWLNDALARTPKTGTILELGSGFGRNAVRIQQLGYRIECTDAVPGFIEILKKQKLNARLLDALHDDYGHSLSMVLANAVLVHFTPEESQKVFRKASDALLKNGIFALSVKLGSGSEWTNEKLEAPRFFHYWQPDNLKKLATDNGFSWQAEYTGLTSSGKASWLYVILTKQ